jgi:hypothetical protein
MDRERLQKLRAEHRPWREGASICVRSGCQGWPCEQSQILDLALEAERLRQDLVKYRRDFQLEQKRGDDLKGEAERLRAAIRKEDAALQLVRTKGGGASVVVWESARTEMSALVGTEAKS